MAGCRAMAWMGKSPPMTMCPGALAAGVLAMVCAIRLRCRTTHRCVCMALRLSELCSEAVCIPPLTLSLSFSPSLFLFIPPSHSLVSLYLPFLSFIPYFTLSSFSCFPLLCLSLSLSLPLPLSVTFCTVCFPFLLLHLSLTSHPG